jgi:hypothetical protein
VHSLTETALTGLVRTVALMMHKILIVRAAVVSLGGAALAQSGSYCPKATIAQGSECEGSAPRPATEGGNAGTTTDRVARVRQRPKADRATARAWIPGRRRGEITLRLSAVSSCPWQTPSQRRDCSDMPDGQMKRVLMRDRRQAHRWPARGPMDVYREVRPGQGALRTESASQGAELVRNRSGAVVDLIPAI